MQTDIADECCGVAGGGGVGVRVPGQHLGMPQVHFTFVLAKEVLCVIVVLGRVSPDREQVEEEDYGAGQQVGHQARHLAGDGR